MRYCALATDYDGTLATGGRVNQSTVEALERFCQSGRKLLLVSGRPLEDLLKLFPRIDLCDRVVAENGALIYSPETEEQQLLGEPVPQALIDEIHRKGLPDFHIGHGIINAYEPYQKELLEIIQDLGLEWHLVFNKGNVMVLPAGVNKASGLMAALKELGLSPRNTVGVGDAENDHAFLAICEARVAVANAVPSLKEQADLVTSGAESVGVVELIDQILKDDLASLEQKLKRRQVAIGHDLAGEEIGLHPYGLNVLVSGYPLSGKSTFARNFIEGLERQGYQYCLIDPEGDYQEADHAVTMGSENQAPEVQSVIDLLEKTQQNCTVDMLSIQYADRPYFFRELINPLEKLREKTGRPHWIILDEAHHLIPSDRSRQASPIPHGSKGLFLITTSPQNLDPSILSEIDLFLFVGRLNEEDLENLPLDLSGNEAFLGKHAQGEVVAWWNRPGAQPFLFKSLPPDGDHMRHRRKYAQGVISPDYSFYFRGPENKLALRAENLMRFLELADGVDDETWNFHLRNGDITRWFEKIIKDDDLANASRQAAEQNLSPDESRALIRKEVEKHYTGPA
jgi:hydroxymethylpyrimidine pyrophosphatase-like HAD family hydrolase